MHTEGKTQKKPGGQESRAGTRRGSAGVHNRQDQGDAPPQPQPQGPPAPVIFPHDAAGRYRTFDDWQDDTMADQVANRRGRNCASIMLAIRKHFLWRHGWAVLSDEDAAQAMGGIGERKAAEALAQLRRDGAILTHKIYHRSAGGNPVPERRIYLSRPVTAAQVPDTEDDAILPPGGVERENPCECPPGGRNMCLPPGGAPVTAPRGGGYIPDHLMAGAPQRAPASHIEIEETDDISLVESVAEEGTGALERARSFPIQDSADDLDPDAVEILAQLGDAVTLEDLDRLRADDPGATLCDLPDPDAGDVPDCGDGEDLEPISWGEAVTRLSKLYGPRLPDPLGLIDLVVFGYLEDDRAAASSAAALTVDLIDGIARPDDSSPIWRNYRTIIGGVFASEDRERAALALHRFERATRKSFAALHPHKSEETTR